MKNYIINFTIKYIDKNKECSEEEKQIIRYGIGNLYLQLTKLVVITLLALFLKIIVPFTIFLLTFNIIRFVSFGMHAKKSWQCWISSTLIFIGIPLISTKIIIPTNIKLLIAIICVIMIYLYSPADTEKRPIISHKRRLIFKYLSVIISLIYLLWCLYIKNQIVANSLLFSLILQSIIINPITYKIFGLSYNNYERYGKENTYVC